jgi:uncharacterized protein (TIGR03066 family)
MKSKARRSKGAPNRADATRKAADRNLTAERSRARRVWLLAIVLVGVVAAASCAVFAFVLPDSIPPEVVGKWRVTGGDWQGMTLEFTRNGTMIGKATINGSDRELEGQATVSGNTLRTTTTNPFTGKAETGTQAIITLTETEFVVEDQQGRRTTMTRSNRP